MLKTLTSVKIEKKSQKMITLTINLENLTYMKFKIVYICEKYLQV